MTPSLLGHRREEDLVPEGRAVAAVVAQRDPALLAVAQRGGHLGDRLRIGLRPLEQRQRLADDLLGAVARQLLEGLVDVGDRPVAVLPGVGDHDAVVGRRERALVQVEQRLPAAVAQVQRDLAGERRDVVRKPVVGLGLGREVQLEHALAAPAGDQRDPDRVARARGDPGRGGRDRDAVVARQARPVAAARIAVGGAQHEPVGSALPRQSARSLEDVGQDDERLVQQLLGRQLGRETVGDRLLAREQPLRALGGLALAGHVEPADDRVEPLAGGQQGCERGRIAQLNGLDVAGDAVGAPQRSGEGGGDGRVVVEYERSHGSRCPVATERIVIAHHSSLSAESASSASAPAGKAARMPGTIVVGYDGSDHGADALRLGRVLARLTDADVVVACAYPEEPLGERVTGGEISRELREDAEARLARARELMSADGAVELRALAGPSPSEVLHRLAEQLDAEAIVLGTTHHGTALGRLAGSTPEHVLDHAPCPVAVAPEGFAQRGAAAPHRIVVALDDSAEAQRALEAAVRLARGSGARVRLVTAIGSGAIAMTSPLDATSYDQFAALAREQARSRLEQAAARLSDVEVEIDVLEGEPADALVRAAREDDLLVAGSRGGGPLRRVLLGSVSRQLLRSAVCPVLIVPRGEDEPA